MRAMMMGNIAASVSAHIAESLGDAVDEDVLKGVVKEVLPAVGIVIAADKEEFIKSKSLGGLLYRDCDIVVRPDCEKCLREDGNEACPYYGEPDGCNKREWQAEAKKRMDAEEGKKKQACM